MSRAVKNFDSFSEENRINEMWGIDDIKGMLGKVIPTLGEGFSKTLKQKLAATLMKKFGILEKSDLSAIVQEIVDAVPVADIPDIISGNKTDSDYWAPIVAQAIQEFIQRKGIDPIFEKIGIDPNGWIASTIRESMQTQLGKDKLKNLILFAFNGAVGKGKDAVSLGSSTLDSLDPEHKDQLTSAFSKAAGQVRPTYSTFVDDRGRTIDQSKSKDDKGGGLMDMIKSFVSGAAEPKADNSRT